LLQVASKVLAIESGQSSYGERNWSVVDGEVGECLWMMKVGKKVTEAWCPGGAAAREIYVTSLGSVPSLALQMLDRNAPATSTASSPASASAANFKGQNLLLCF